MNQEFSKIDGLIDANRTDLVEKMSAMIGIRAMSPKSGGDGEMRRAEYLEGILKSWGLETKRYDYTDDTGTVRPNIITRIGSSDMTIWFVGHMDTVSEGDPKLWKSDPFTARVDGDMMYGRGTVDDGIGVFSAMYALKAMKDSGAAMKYNFGLALVSDEELGSLYGMDRLVKEPGLFKKGDMFCVLDMWSVDGARIEIGEKGMLWLKITVNGKQVHASTPADGKNAYRYAINFIHEADEFLHRKYNRIDHLFEPEYSTFEMTKHEKNTDSINIIPGTDVSYIDCRVLPGYDLDEIINDLKGITKSDAYAGVRIDIEQYSRTDSGPITPPDSEIVNLVSAALKDLRHIDSRKSGIGGGTCASFARKAGMDAVAWGTSAEVAHQPNEHVRISDIINDAKVLAYICLDHSA